MRISVFKKYLPDECVPGLCQCSIYAGLSFIQKKYISRLYCHNYTKTQMVTASSQNILIIPADQTKVGSMRFHFFL